MSNASWAKDANKGLANGFCYGQKFLPTPVEAQTLWLTTLGLSVEEIATATGRSKCAVANALLEAQRKARVTKLRVFGPKTKRQASQRLGIAELQRLAVEAGLEVPK